MIIVFINWHRTPVPKKCRSRFTLKLVVGTYVVGIHKYIIILDRISRYSIGENFCHHGVTRSVIIIVWSGMGVPPDLKEREREREKKEKFTLAFSGGYSGIIIN
jgi:hypothetical protein